MHSELLSGALVCLMQVSLPSQLERDSSGASSSDDASVSASTSSTSSQSQKFSSPLVHRDVQRVTATARRGTQQHVLVKTLVITHTHWYNSAGLYDIEHHGIAKSSTVLCR